MNLTKLFEMQRKLDERIVHEKGLEGRDLLPEKILALQVELGECANEWRGFKFWSEDREPRVTEDVGCSECKGYGFKVEIDDSCSYTSLPHCKVCNGDGIERVRNPLLEEYVDCLHFILSIGLENGFGQIVDRLSIESVTCIDVVRQFSALMESDWGAYKALKSGYYHEGFELFLGLGEMLGFEWTQIESAYFEKNKINHSRQDNGY